jgi:hypothetical protein
MCFLFLHTIILIDWKSELTTDSEVSRVWKESGDEAEPDAAKIRRGESDSEYQP